MFSFKNHDNNLYNTLLDLSRNTFFYKTVGLKDSFETRIYLMFMHFSILMIIFKKKEHYLLAKKMRDHGMRIDKKYWHDEIGFNFRMTNLQAAIGCAQLEKAKKFVNRKIQIFKRYNLKLEI